MVTDRYSRMALFLRGRGNLTGIAGVITVGLLVAPLLLVIFKLSALPGSETVRNLISLTGLHGDVSHKVETVMFVPLAALLIVIFRVTLGIRVLGPFRSILLAVAFRMTGVVIGLVFLTLVVLVIVVVRPSLRAIRLPYFGRVAAALCVVVVTIAVVLVAGRWMNIDSLTSVAYLPIVVLCLTADGFARTLNREGLRSALWRGGMTALAAVIITGLASIDLMADVTKRYPELVIVYVGLIIVVSEYFGFRFLAFLNPPPVKPKRKNQRNGRLINKPRESETHSSRDPVEAIGTESVNQQKKG